MIPKIRIACTLVGEARGESTAGRLCVASTLQERLKDGRWGHTYEAVCTAPWQFSCWNAKDPNRPMLEKLAASLEAGEEPVDPIVKECLWIADGVLAGVLTPQMKNATHYYSTSMASAPFWAMGATYVGQQGLHRFYAGVK